MAPTLPNTPPTPAFSDFTKSRCTKYSTKNAPKNKPRNVAGISPTPPANVPKSAPAIPPIIAPATALFDAPNFFAPIITITYSNNSPARYRKRRIKSSFMFIMAKPVPAA